MELTAYLNFNGNCEEAFRFYEKLLGGKIQGIFHYAGTPAEQQVQAEWRNKVMHVTLTAGKSTLMGTDAPPGRFQPSQGYTISLALQDPAEAERIYQGLAEGGQIKMPLQETFWARKFAMLIDRFGIPWMINCGGQAA